MTEVERLTAERDKAREDCGFEKGMRAAMRVELDMFIRLSRQAGERVAAVQVLVDQSVGMHLHGGGWVPGSLSVAEVCEALGIETPGPPPPATEEERAEIRRWMDEIRAERTNGAAGERTP